MKKGKRRVRKLASNKQIQLAPATKFANNPSKPVSWHDFVRPNQKGFGRHRSLENVNLEGGLERTPTRSNGKRPNSSNQKRYERQRNIDEEQIREISEYLQERESS